MQWRFTTSSPSSGLAAASGVPLKRKPSNSQLQSMAGKQHRAGVSPPAAAADLSEASGGTAAAAPMAVDPVAVDVQAVAAKHGWDLQQRNDWSNDKQVMWLPVAAIRRPLQGSRSNDPEKVSALMKSIAEIGMQEPIDVLEVDGSYWGFSGCHRYEAHVRLGKEQILCRVRKSTRQVLKFHMM